MADNRLLRQIKCKDRCHHMITMFMAIMCAEKLVAGSETVKHWEINTVLKGRLEVFSSLLTWLSYSYRRSLVVFLK